MWRIVVQPRAAGALRLGGRFALTTALAVAAGCAHPVRMAPDVRIRPCGAVVDLSGRPIDRSLLSWESPDQVDERTELDAWCDTVGPAILAQSRPPVRLPSDRLVIVGWNVHLGAGDVVGLIGELRHGRIAGVDPDAPLVLMLQETFRAGDLVPPFSERMPAPPRLAPGRSRQDVLDIAAVGGFNVFYLPTMRNGRGTDVREDRGLAILSSLPLDQVQAFELPLERQRRPAAAVVVRLASSSGTELALRLINTHLESRSGARRLWLGSPHARNRQGQALSAALDADAPTVLEGDLNTWANREPVLARLRRRFEPCTDRRPTFGAGLRLDWFFSRLPQGWTTTCWRLDQKYGSDHYPIVAVVHKLRSG